MAQALASAIEQHASYTALMLGGWSFEGVVAFEIARILIARGAKVQCVVLIDSPFPSAPPLLSDSLVEHLIRDKERTVDSSTTALVVRQFRRNTALLDGYLPSAGDGEVSLAFLRCTAGFCPDDVEDVPAWFCERDDAGRGGGWIVEPWGSLVGGAIPVWDVPGHHFEPFPRVHVEETSVQLDRACRYLETL
ncbi:alpha/beta-hydrolase [Imleria badia]|nr:alpha/beta-hydrolase [Imleria badia]